MTSDIHLAELRSPDDALDMAHCRNQVREFMTHNNAVILPTEQLKWYRETYIPSHERGEIYGFVVRDGLLPIGYGIVSMRDEKWWVSGGLVEASRGTGAGHLLFDQMTTMIHEDLQSDESWLDVLKTNERAHALYKRLGYEVVKNTETLFIMVHEEEATS